MRSYLLTSFKCLTILCCEPAFAADSGVTGANDVAHAGGLMCFTIPPSKTNPGQSCDRLCVALGAVCVGLTLNGAINPGLGCADSLEAGQKTVASCRCCAAEL